MLVPGLSRLIHYDHRLAQAVGTAGVVVMESVVCDGVGVPPIIPVGNGELGTTGTGVGESVVAVVVGSVRK